MNVPFYKPSIGDEEIEAVAHCLRSGWLTSGEQCARFEEEFARYLSAEHAVTFNSCTAALHVALDALGIGPGDLVAVPTMTFSATAQAAVYLGATPVFVDIEPGSMCMDAASLRALAEAVSSRKPWPGLPGNASGRLRAVMPVHFAGDMADMVALGAVAREYDLHVVDDAAHTLPAYLRADGAWQMVGWGSEITCFSFYPNKPITTAEGGMAVTDDEALAEKMRVLRLHGIDRDAWKRYGADGAWHYDIAVTGYKYNMPDLCAAIGRVQLRKADELWQERRRVASALADALADVDEIELPAESPDRRHSWHLFVVRLRPGSRLDRDTLIRRLRDAGVVASLHYKPLHEHTVFRRKFALKPEDFPVAHEIWQNVLSLPLYPFMTDEEIACVGATVKNALAAGP